MLNQDERRRFNDIAHQLAADPEFAHLTQLPSAPPDRPTPPPNRPVPTILLLSVVLYLTAPFLALLGGWAAAAPAMGVYLVTVAGVLLHRRRTSRDD